MEYAELQVTSNFSFLRGGSSPEELVRQAIKLGYHSIAITDRNTVAGLVRAHRIARIEKFKFIPACRLAPPDGPSLLAYPTDVYAWTRLSGLLTKGNLRTEKGKCDLYKNDVFEHAKGIKFIVIPPAQLNERFDFDDDFKQNLQEYKAALGDNLYIAASRLYNGDDTKRLYRISKLGVPMVATNNVYYHEKSRRELQDVVTCVREKCTITNAGFKLYANAERYFKDKQEMDRLFLEYRDAIARTIEIADACLFSLDTLKYLEPEWVSPDGRTADEHLAAHTWVGVCLWFFFG